ncbi:MAG: hypothetical protein HC817_01745 [Saprospiraceae bacterium]|nr:hypothetical protein [Saprospiraceae bacterium]
MPISTRYTLVFIFICYLTSAFLFRKNSDMCIIANGDAVGYYTYLPAFFIHHDLRDLRQTTLARMHELPEQKINKMRLEDLNDGHFTGSKIGNNHLIQYTYGIAFLQSPSFFWRMVPLNYWVIKPMVTLNYIAFLVCLMAYYSAF